VQWYKADLHIHSVLSPCGGLEMSPSALVNRAKELKLDIIAITDHNTMANCPAYKQVVEKENIKLICGVEIQTAEEIHLVALFDDDADILDFDRELYDSLLNIPNDPDYFGDQVVIDAEENIIRCEEKALINSSVWTLEEAIQKVHEYSGFCYPAHVDAHTFSVIGQLGFIPGDLKLDAIGLTAHAVLEDVIKKYPYLEKYALIRSSDAHYLADIGSGYETFWIEKPTIEEIKMACDRVGGRRIKNDKDKINRDQEE
jgi:3',5'-nucleoside bisphosphate phosphatase